MKIQNKVLAIATAAMIGIATTGGAALARGGGGFGGGHIGGFGDAHMGVVAGPHVGSFGIGHMGGIGVQDRGLDDHGLGRARVSHELGHHHFRGLYGVSPLYDTNDCSLPADLTIESCPVGSGTE
jgi:hypothetical protein